jgi:hypothetical protein
MGDHVVSHDEDLPLPTPEPGPHLPRPGRRSLRWAVNLWLFFHLAAIVIAPAAVGPSSDLVRSAWDLFQPYVEVLYLNHGYHFFAPDPEESTLLAFEAERPDGTIVRGRIPDPATRPRLLYHRYFMLTEHMNTAREELLEQWHKSYARHIGREYGARHVKLIKQTHLLPTMERIRDGGRLTDPESYEDQPLGDFPCDGY